MMGFIFVNYEKINITIRLHLDYNYIKCIDFYKSNGKIN